MQTLCNLCSARNDCPQSFIGFPPMPKLLSISTPHCDCAMITKIHALLITFWKCRCDNSSAYDFVKTTFKCLASHARSRQKVRHARPQWRQSHHSVHALEISTFISALFCHRPSRRSRIVYCEALSLAMSRLGVLPGKTHLTVCDYSTEKVQAVCRHYPLSTSRKRKLTAEHL